MSSLPLKCRCGKIQGEVREVSANSGKRLVCMCDDCQSYAYQMGRADDILDPSGGTEVYQTTPSNITITQGAEHLSCLRLSPKGLMRWYAGCCDTPIANTLPRHKVPFAGVVHSFFDRDALGDDGGDGGELENKIGPIRARIQGRFGHAPFPPGSYQRAPILLIGQSVASITKAWLAGKHTPTPFFDADGEPVVRPKIVSEAERNTLRERVTRPPAG